ncbi:MAG: hypothetical protein J6S57_03060 [Alphaproteobacteria bacterium]|nr:hypothetical protein [Alphaproteobacteria bacterium]
MKKQIKRIKKSESGRSMVEMVGVLAVMGLITAAAFVLITSALRTQKMSRLDDEVSVMVAGIRTLYTNSGGVCSPIAPGDTDQSKGLSEAVGVSGNNPFGGTYSLGVTATCQPRVMISGIKNQCEGLKSKSWGAGKAVSTPNSLAPTCVDGSLTVTFDAQAGGTERV